MFECCSGLVDLVVGVGRDGGGGHRLALVDERFVGRLAEDIAEVGDRGAELLPGPLVIDTDGLDFMGCCAFTALAEEADRCRCRGIRMCLVSRRPGVGRIIAAAALGSRLRLYPNMDTALSAAAAAT